MPRWGRRLDLESLLGDWTPAFGAVPAWAYPLTCQSPIRQGVLLVLQVGQLRQPAAPTRLSNAFAIAAAERTLVQTPAGHCASDRLLSWGDRG